jgi:hypothetical protein
LIFWPEQFNWNADLIFFEGTNGGVALTPCCFLNLTYPFGEIIMHPPKHFIMLIRHNIVGVNNELTIGIQIIYDRFSHGIMVIKDVFTNVPFEG